MLTYHPAATEYPMIEGEARDEFRADIAANGIRQRIVMLDDMVLDGRNRFEAGLAAGLFAEDVDWRFFPDHFRAFGSEPGDGEDPYDFVFSLNFNRRELTRGHRLVLAAQHATRKQGARTDLLPRVGGLNLSPIGGASQGEAAEKFGVPKRAVERMHIVLEKGAPELVEMVKADALSVSAAEVVARLPQDEQQALVATADPKVIVAKAAEVRAEKKPDPIVAAAAERLGQPLTPASQSKPALSPEGRGGDGRGVDALADMEARIERDTSAWQARLTERRAAQARQGEDDDAVGARPPHATRFMPIQGRPYVLFFEGMLAMTHVDDAIADWQVLDLARELGLVVGDNGPADWVKKHIWDVTDIPKESAGSIHPEPSEGASPSADTSDSGEAGADGDPSPLAVNGGAAAVTAAPHTRETARPILEARYATEGGQALAAELGIPINTLRTWAHKLGLTSKARISAMASERNRRKSEPGSAQEAKARNAVGFDIEGEP